MAKIVNCNICGKQLINNEICQCKAMNITDYLYKMQLHEQLEISSNFIVTRVSGGWIYSIFGGSVFVHYSNEFKQENNITITKIYESEE